jgi:hypothetical protein
MVCRLYVRFCRRFGPRRMTFSAWAWVHARETGNTFFRDRIDGLFLLLAGNRNHCQAAFQREQRIHTATD